MLKETNTLRKLLSILIIVLLVAYALIVCLPNGHDCIGADCAVCSIIDSAREILIGVSLLTIAKILPRIIFMLPALHERIVFFSEGTPVGLKVKLSD